jgi:hypothetical protein
MILFLYGGSAAASAVIGLFFVHYWRISLDRLFAFFAAAFWLLTLHWVGLASLNVDDDASHWLYVVRLFSFLLIIIAIVDKNRRGNTD